MGLQGDALGVRDKPDLPGVGLSIQQLQKLPAIGAARGDLHILNSAVGVGGHQNGRAGGDLLPLKPGKYRREAHRAGVP